MKSDFSQNSKHKYDDIYFIAFLWTGGNYQCKKRKICAVNFFWQNTFKNVCPISSDIISTLWSSLLNYRKNRWYGEVYCRGRKPLRLTLLRIGRQNMISFSLDFPGEGAFLKCSVCVLLPSPLLLTCRDMCWIKQHYWAVENIIKHLH